MPPDVMLVALPFGTAFIVSMLFAPGMIYALKRRGVGQTISEDGPESHKPKAGTPTMGGLIILAGILAAVLVLTYLGRSATPVLGTYTLGVLLLVLGYAGVGMVDDYLTIHPIGGVRGIASKPKAAVQVLLAIAFVSWLAVQKAGTFEPMLIISGKVILSGIWYWAFSVVFLVAMANFVNITDGLDGLVSGLGAIAAFAFAATLMLCLQGRAGQDALYWIYLLQAIAGACVAFLWFNTNPAKVFMGDTGALAIGVALPAVAILAHAEILMIVIGLVFVMDGFSTIIQWAVFKFTRITTGVGRRVFKKSPIHHHFELSGWPEQTVVVRFWICGLIAALIGFTGASLGWW